MAEEELALEVVIELMNGLESGIEAARQRIRERKLPEENLSFEKLAWEEKQGKKEPFQQTNENANNNSELWKVLKTKLKEHSGFWQNQGFKYWFDMHNELVIDRRKTG